jgi:hypothetical protein
MMPLVFITILVIGGLGAFMLFKPKSKTPTTNTVVSNTTNTTVTNTANSNTVANANANANTNTSVVATETATATWTTPKKITSKNLLPSLWAPVLSSEYGTPLPVYSEVGTLKTTKYNGAKVIQVAWYGEGPQFYATYNYFLLLSDGSYVYPMKLNGGDQGAEVPPAKIFPVTTVVDTTFDPKFPTAPKTITGPKAHQTLVLDSNVAAQFSGTGLTVAFTDATYGPVYWTGKDGAPKKDAEIIGAVPITSRAGFYVKSPIGQVWVYRMKFDFMTKVTDGNDLLGVPDITWTDGSKNTSFYSATSLGGCGSTNYADVADGVTLASLTPVGTAVTGETFYTYTDSNAKALKDYYETTYQVYGSEKKVSYATFIADRPLLFYVDSFGRLLRLTNNSYKTMAECGKPVIYLYPTTPTNVSVQLQPVGGFSKTVPSYGNGWNVLAKPTGELTNRADGKTYPYLFWEGRGGLYSEPTEGAVVAQSEVHSFLVSNLGKLGLNHQETADFIEFWEPRMQGSPYYKVSFLGTQTMDQLAPMTITPKPDTVIRILMDFRPLQSKISIPAQRLGHIPRTGFTVIEWGGVLR